MAWGIDRADCVFCGRGLAGTDPDEVPFPPVCQDCEGQAKVRLVAESDQARAKYLTDGSQQMKETEK